MYYDTIDAIIIKNICNTDSFFELVCLSKGIHPIEICDSLKRLLHSCQITPDKYETITASMGHDPDRQIDDDINAIPIPHQVDYDWRFSKQGIASIATKIEEIIKSSDVNAIAFIGSPSLFKHFSYNTNQDITYYLIDFNAVKHVNIATFPENFKIINCNVNYQMPEDLYKDIEVDIVVMDPPWYLEYYKRFFDICDNICKEGAYVLGVFPPVLTRSTIPEEATQLTEYANILGFSDMVFHEHTVVYSTPPFEKNVLSVNGIRNYPSNWRVGDLFETRCESEAATIHTYEDLSTEASKWQETNVGIIRIKCRQKPIEQDEYFSITIRRMYPQDIYPSVSRRYKGHEDINVWTSGNRVYHCSNIPLFKLIVAGYNDINLIQSLESEYGTYIDEDKKSEIIAAQKLIQEVINIEKKEYGHWKSCITI